MQIIDIMNAWAAERWPLLLEAAAGLIAGGLLAAAWLRGRIRRLSAANAELAVRIKAEETIRSERAEALEQAEQRLAAAFGKLANESLTHSSETFLRLARESLGKHHEQSKAGLLEREKAIEELVKPIQQALEQTHKQIGDIEKGRLESFGSITAQLELMTAEQKALRTHTSNLVTALRRPEVRGQWGELTLRRIAELAGMVEHCDFIEQAHTTTDDGTIRPDMVVRLPDRGEIVVDVKTPLDAYLQAVEASDDESRRRALQRHTRNVAERVRELSTKAYWSQFDASPEFVILFIPGDQFLAAALNENPNLLEDALRQKVILATPTSLVALLKAIAYGWRQLALAENAEEIRRLAQDMHARLTTFTGASRAPRQATRQRRQGIQQGGRVAGAVRAARFAQVRRTRRHDEKNGRSAGKDRNDGPGNRRSVGAAGTGHGGGLRWPWR